MPGRKKYTCPNCWGENGLHSGMDPCPSDPDWVKEMNKKCTCIQDESRDWIKCPVHGEARRKYLAGEPAKKMRFGFDIDGTITAAPEAFKAIMVALKASGHEVHVLTGQVSPITNADFKSRTKQLASVGIDEGDYDKLFIAGPPDWVADKAYYCKYNKIDFMFENDPGYSQAISEYTPTTMMWVHQ